MRLLRRLPALLGLLLLAAALAAWLLPTQLDPERFRGPLQALASRTLGAPVRITGPIRLALLPRLVLQTGAIEVSAATGLRLAAQGLELRLAPASLLAGRVEARSLLLYRPTLTWPRPFDSRALLLHRAAWLGTAPIRVEDGTLATATGTLRGIAATIDPDPLTGDVRLAGAVRLAGVAWQVALQLSQPGGDGAATLALSLDGRASLQGTAFAFSGQVAADGTVQGHGTAHGPDLSRLLPCPALPFAADGRVSFAGGLAEADDVALTLGQAPARAAIALLMQPTLRLDLALTTSRLALDPWLAALRRAPATGLPLGVDLSAEAASLAGGTLRSLRAGFDLADGTLRLREFHATAPGDATLGLLGEARGERFRGEVTLDAPDWPTTARWLRAVLPGNPPLPPGAALHGTAHAEADPAGVALDHVSARLDETQASGAVAWRQRSTATPAQLSAQLQLQHLSLDRWQSVAPADADLAFDLRMRDATFRGFRATTAAVSGARRSGAWTLRQLAATAPGLTLTGSGRLSAEGRLDDAQATLAAAPARALAGLPGSPAWLSAPIPLLQQSLRVDAAMSGSGEALSVDLRGRLAALDMTASPVLDLGRLAWRGPLALRAPSARAVVEASGLLGRAGLPSRTDWLGDGSLALTAEASGDAAGLALDRLSLIAGAMRLGGSVRVGWGGVPSLDGRIAAASLPLPAWPVLLQAWLGGSMPAGTARLDVTADQVLADGVPALAPAAAKLALAGGHLALDDVQAGIAGGTLGGSGALDLGAEPPSLTLAATLQDVALPGALAGTPVDVATGLLSGQIDVSAAGHSLAAVVGSLQGTATLRVGQGVLHGVALDTALPPDLPEAAVAAALDGGSTRFARLDLALRLQQGVASLSAGRIDLPSGHLALSGTDDLARGSVDMRLRFQPRRAAASPLHPGLPPPSLGLHLLGARGAVQRIPELAALAQWRAAGEAP